MRRLRHPIRAIREPFGKAGLIVAVLALVFAMLGGAYAAKDGNGGGQVATASKKKQNKAGLNGKEKKEVKKIAKRFAGKRGKQGKQGKAGTNGTNGTNGKDGANGAQGPAGPQGAAGANGAPGAGVTSKAVAVGVPTKCEGRGGSEFSSASGTTFACNGKEGQTGFATELPAGETSVGVWSTDAVSTEQAATYATISFPYPVAASEYAVHYVTSEEVLNETAPAACPGSTEEPLADAGSLCVYEVTGFGVSFLAEINPENGFPESGAGKMGVILQFAAESNAGFARGTWALTAE